MSIETVTRVLNIPSSLITAELEGLYGTNVLQDMQNTIALYDIYENGADFVAEGSKDYVPANLRYRTA